MFVNDLWVFYDFYFVWFWCDLFYCWLCIGYVIWEGSRVGECGVVVYCFLKGVYVSFIIGSFLLKDYKFWVYL